MMKKIILLILVLFLGFNANAQLKDSGYAKVQKEDFYEGEFKSIRVIAGTILIDIGSDSLIIGRKSYNVIKTSQDKDNNIYKIFTERYIGDKKLPGIFLYYYNPERRKLWSVYKMDENTEYHLTYRIVD